MQADLAALVVPVVIRGLLPVTLILGVPQEVNLMPMLQLHLLLVQTHQLGVDAEDTAAEGEDDLLYLELKADAWFSYDGTQLLQRLQCRNAMSCNLFIHH